MADLRSMGSLGFIATACALLLSVTHWLTQTRITDNLAAKVRRDLHALVSESANIPLSQLPDITSDGSCWTLLEADVRLLRIRAAGYGGDIEVLYTQAIGSGVLLHLRVTAHQETPGIADFLNRPQDGWLASLSGASAITLSQVDTLSGATITSRSLIKALADSLSASRDPESACQN